MDAALEHVALYIFAIPRSWRCDRLDPDCIDRTFVHEGRIRLPLKKFLAQPRLFYDGKWFNTGQILRFVANKLGGNHIDFDRAGEWERLDAANAFMSMLGQRPGNHA